jgi:hypothetical protein
MFELFLFDFGWVNVDVGIGRDDMMFLLIFGVDFPCR